MAAIEFNQGLFLDFMLPSAYCSQTRKNVKPAVLGIAVIVAAFVTPRAAATVFYVNVDNLTPAAPYTNWLTAATDIQDAINASSNGDLILVTNGVYEAGGQAVYGFPTNRVAINKAVTVQSVNGPGVTIIQGYEIPSSATNYSSNVRGVYMTNNTVLNGFSIIGGASFSGGSSSIQVDGGGVYCESTNAILTNCAIFDNSCANKDFSPNGGGIHLGTLYSCTLSNNVVAPYAAGGGGAFGSVLVNCLIISNSASFGGGAEESTLINCTVIGNDAPNYGSVSYGGGLEGCAASGCLITGNFSSGVGGGADSSSLDHCIVSNNIASEEGGGCTDGYATNCLFIANTANVAGGVLFSSSSGTAVNCTIASNTAAVKAGGISGGTCLNTIIFDNICASNSLYANIFDGAFYYSSYETDPGFVNPPSGDFRLQSNSPCINSGENSFILDTNDLDGNPRIVGGEVDIGAYEYQSPTSILSYAWAQQYGLPTDGSADYLDLDGTGMENWQKSIAGLNPTNPASVLVMLTPTVNTSVGRTTVYWQSVVDRFYYVQRSTNLLGSPAWTTIQSNIFGQPTLDSFVDAGAPAGGPCFYRVGVQ